MEDKLDLIYRYQKAFDSDVIERRGLGGITQEEWLQKKVLAMLSELAELLDEVNFKWWKNPKAVSEESVKGELIDILHFFVSMCITAGMDAQEMFDRYMAKNKENFDRQYGRSEKKGYEL